MRVIFNPFRLVTLSIACLVTGVMICQCDDAIAVSTVCSAEPQPAAANYIDFGGGLSIPSLATNCCSLSDNTCPTSGVPVPCLSSCPGSNYVWSPDAVNTASNKVAANYFLTSQGGESSGYMCYEL